MELKTQNRLKLLAVNAQVIKKEFAWHNVLTKRLAALLYAQADRPVDCEAIRSCHNLIKSSTGAFSAFRGNMSLCVAALLSLSPDPQTLIAETLKVYNLLKAAKLRSSDYLVVAAYQIAAQTDPANHTNAVHRTRAFFDSMKTYHFFYTGQDDYIFAAMLGLTDLDAAGSAERIEQIYKRLKSEFWDRNSVQALAQMLMLGENPAEAANRVLALQDALRARRIRLDKPYTLPVLGVLALLPVEINTIVRDIAEAQMFLRLQKGFGVFWVTTQELLLFAAAIVAAEYADSVKDGVLTAALSTGITNIIIAQQAAMIAAISASSTAAASSSGN